MLIKEGQEYSFKDGERLVITKISDDAFMCSIVFMKDDGTPIFPQTVRINSVIDYIRTHGLTRTYDPQTKPIDQAFKELDKKICSHHNIREDRYFSAMVYKTCKDCGKPLN